MVANREITEHQRADVLFIRRLIVAPIWDMKPDGSARLVGRRNVHTGEVEKGRVISARGELRLMSCAARSTSASVIHMEALKRTAPEYPGRGCSRSRSQWGRYQKPCDVNQSSISFRAWSLAIP